MWVPLMLVREIFSIQKSEELNLVFVPLNIDNQNIGFITNIYWLNYKFENY